MTEVVTEPGLFDPTDYWAASARIQELLAMPKDQVTDEHRDEYDANIAIIDEAGKSVMEGRTTGTSILDRLIRSGQIVSAEQLEQLSLTEQMLIVGEPVLLQQGKTWKLGVVVHDELYFSAVHRDSHFGPTARGYQAVPVKSYIELNIGRHNDRSAFYGGMDLRNIEPDDLPPEVGRGIGLPLTEVVGYPFHGDHDIPQGLWEMWQIYDQASGRNSNRYGARIHDDMLYVGREAVETNLGISLEELLGFVDNRALLDYVTNPADRA